MFGFDGRFVVVGVIVVTVGFLVVIGFVVSSPDDCPYDPSDAGGLRVVVVGLLVVEVVGR